jgi:hypothetical protein
VNVPRGLAARQFVEQFDPQQVSGPDFPVTFNFGEKGEMLYLWDVFPNKTLK